LAAAAVPLPPAIQAELAARAQRIVRRNLLLAAETGRLQRGFDAAGIPAVVLKGMALAERAYGAFAIKHSKDIDFLVPPDRAEDALRLLERGGYALVMPAATLGAAQRRAGVRYGHEFAVRRPGREPLVDLRWRLTDNEHLIAGIAPFARSRPLTFSDGIGLRMLDDADHFVYLCVHGASHAWSRLKWLADVNALIALKSADDIARLYRHAQGAGAGVCAGLALLLCRRLLALALPSDLNDTLARSRRLRLLAAMCLDVMAGPDAQTEMEDRRFGSTRVALVQFLLGRGPFFLIEQCRIQSVRLGDVVAYPLPRALHFLYPLLRLPLWLWRRARRFGGNEPLRRPDRPRQNTPGSRR
jgi:hypothetical protein